MNISKNKTVEEGREYFSYICNEFGFKKINESEYQYNKSGNKISIYLDETKQLSNWNWERKEVENKKVWNLKKEENIITLILVLNLLEVGYYSSDIILEKSFRVGTTNVSVDILIEKEGKSYWMIEVKTPETIKEYTGKNIEEKKRQLFTYLHQDSSVEYSSYYTYLNKENKFYNIVVDESLIKNTATANILYDKWKLTKGFDETNLLTLPAYGIKIKEKKDENLKVIQKSDSKELFKNFITILRLNSVSDKSNAFDKLINLLIAKVYDERTGNKEIRIRNYSKILQGLHFQFVTNADTPESFMIRLSELYKHGMKQLLEKDILDYSEEQIRKKLRSKASEEVLKMFEDIRLKKGNAFTFIEVFDNDTFYKNYLIVRDVVELLSKFRFRYNEKSSCLGDFFENLLNTSLKEEFGQFFTPYPLVDFMVNSLPLQEKIKENIRNNQKDMLPYFIDYACGSGHFLISYINKLQEEIDLLKHDILDDDYPKELRERLVSLKNFEWAEKYVYGIEKDYRLAKTAKASLFLHGDGEAKILHADALNKFSCNEFLGTILSASSSKNKIEKFDFVVSNPPFSVEGYTHNLENVNKIKIGDGTFELIKEFNDRDTMIEIVFLERSWQLLKEDGFVFIILPHNFLSVRRYGEARRWMLERFKILAIFCSGDISFGSTSTSPAIFFMRKSDSLNLRKLDYQCLLINSPKALANYENVAPNEERKFLDYRLSKARTKSGTEPLNNFYLINNYSHLIREMCLDTLKEKEDNLTSDKKTDKYSRFVILKDIILNDYRETKIENKIIKEGNIYAFYPRYVKRIKRENEFCLKEVCEINKHSKEEISKEFVGSLEYVEIGKLKEKGERIIGEFDEKKSWRLAKKGDLLFPKLAASNWKKQIRIADRDLKVSPAIYTLTFDDEKIKSDVQEYLKENKNDILQDIKSLSDGFKVSKVEITEFNLMNNIWFIREEEKI